MRRISSASSCPRIFSMRNEETARSSFLLARNLYPTHVWRVSYRGVAMLKVRLFS